MPSILQDYSLENDALMEYVPNVNRNLFRLYHRDSETLNQEVVNKKIKWFCLPRRQVLDEQGNQVQTQPFPVPPEEMQPFNEEELLVPGPKKSQSDQGMTGGETSHTDVDETAQSQRRMPTPGDPFSEDLPSPATPRVRKRKLLIEENVYNIKRSSRINNGPDRFPYKEMDLSNREILTTDRHLQANSSLQDCIQGYQDEPLDLTKKEKKAEQANPSLEDFIVKDYGGLVQRIQIEPLDLTKKEKKQANPSFQDSIQENNGELLQLPNGEKNTLDHQPQVYPGVQDSTQKNNKELAQGIPEQILQLTNGEKNTLDHQLQVYPGVQDFTQENNKELAQGIPEQTVDLPNSEKNTFDDQPKAYPGFQDSTQEDFGELMANLKDISREEIMCFIRTQCPAMLLDLPENVLSVIGDDINPNALEPLSSNTGKEQISNDGVPLSSNDGGQLISNADGQLVCNASGQLVSNGSVQLILNTGEQYFFNGGVPVIPNGNLANETRGDCTELTATPWDDVNTNDIEPLSPEGQIISNTVNQHIFNGGVLVTLNGFNHFPNVTSGDYTELSDDFLKYINETELSDDGGESRGRADANGGRLSIAEQQAGMELQSEAD